MIGGAIPQSDTLSQNPKPSGDLGFVFSNPLKVLLYISSLINSPRRGAERAEAVSL
jgi:hypothetical protein